MQIYSVKKNNGIKKINMPLSPNQLIITFIQFNYT